MQSPEDSDDWIPFTPLYLEGADLHKALAAASINPTNILPIYSKHDYDWFLPNKFMVANTVADDWFLVTFKPYETPYEDDIDWYNNKMLDEVRKYVTKKTSDSLYFFIAKEQSAERTHCHMLVHSSSCLMHLSGNKICKKRGFLSIYSVTNTKASRTRVFEYITKECLYHDWFKFNHFNHSKLRIG